MSNLEMKQPHKSLQGGESPILQSLEGNQPQQQQPQQQDHTIRYLTLNILASAYAHKNYSYCHSSILDPYFRFQTISSFIQDHNPEIFTLQVCFPKNIKQIRSLRVF